MKWQAAVDNQGIFFLRALKTLKGYTQQGAVSPYLLASSHVSSTAGRGFTNLSNQADISCPHYCQRERKGKRGGRWKATDRVRAEKTYRKSSCHYCSWLSVSAGTHAHIHTCKWVSNPQTECSFACLHVCIHPCWHIYTHITDRACGETQYGKHACLLKP